MKRRVVKKKMRRILNSELPTMFKLSAMTELIKASSKSGSIKFKKYIFNKFTKIIMFARFSTSSHKDVVTVSEHDRVDEISFSSWHKAMNWICKQAEIAYDNDKGVECYVLDSGHYRYRMYFLEIRNNEVLSGLKKITGYTRNILKINCTESVC